jgi:two-component system, OmpR family, response regulator
LIPFSVATLNGIKLDLGPMEFRLLSHLLLNRGKAVSQAELTEALYGPAGEPGSNAVESLVRRVRRKVGEDTIATQRGFGYFISAEAR